MSVSIRLARIGKKHAPAYRVVITKTRTKRNGEFIDIIGNYNPADPTTEFTFDKKKYEDWVKKGAIVSDAVKKLVDGTYQYEKYDPKADKEKEKTDDSVDTKSEKGDVEKDVDTTETAKESAKEDKAEDPNTEKEADTPDSEENPEK